MPHSIGGRPVPATVASGLASAAQRWAGPGGELKTADDRKAAEPTTGLEEDFNNRTLNSDMNFMLTQNSELDFGRQGQAGKAK